MDYSFKQKVLMFMCELFGHKFDTDKEWSHRGATWNTCKRCKHVIYIKESTDD